MRKKRTDRDFGTNGWQNPKLSSPNQSSVLCSSTEVFRCRRAYRVKLSLTHSCANMGFRKVDPDKWEFANEGFLRGQKHMLKNLRRKKTPSQLIIPQQQCVEVGSYGLDSEINRLTRDKQALMAELSKLRQQQQNTRANLRTMERRLQGTELKQQLMMTFLARAMQNPGFIQQLAQHRERRKELEEAITKKRRRPIDQGPGNVVEVGESNQSGGWEGRNPIKIKSEDFRDPHGFEVSELEMLAMEMQGLGKSKKEEEEDKDEEDETEHESEDGEVLDEGFWEELLDEYLGGEEVVNVLTDKFGCLGSSPKRDRGGAGSSM
ncbi:heat stress transcription factor A-6b-like isoform X2 [Macadamia integrifolia]|uniref:heat stress transcription factor A-6b-like isoform X2 n=1 Tax=Macadamia integrifolia TaxID=60698 RepID=UPI001C4E7242|nr:heat stress transcription factor A-6b-like isoform X2 [Macadamia integrifolia]